MSPQFREFECFTTAAMNAFIGPRVKQVSAGIGNLHVVAFSGLRGEQRWVHMEIFEGSYGGRHGIDGMDAVDTLYANPRPTLAT